MKIKGVIFDLDGVIVHTDEFHYQAWKKIADRINVPFDREINNRLRGVSRLESLEIILENSEETFSSVEKDLLAEEKNEIYKNLLSGLNENDVDSSVVDTLKNLKREGFKLAIGSSSKNANYILRQVKLLDYFDAISDGNNIRNSKPNPEVFIKAAEFLYLSPNECIVVEDAKAGIDAAILGGFKNIGIGDASNYDKSEYKINNFSEIENIAQGLI